jgi:hypothetical protein
MPGFGYRTAEYLDSITKVSYFDTLIPNISTVASTPTSCLDILLFNPELFVNFCSPSGPLPRNKPQLLRCIYLPIHHTQ